ncbi:MAG: aminotransferase class I/II-fold pyridoxal phosphate-dependent enzyme [Chloroflexota bacterium]
MSHKRNPATVSIHADKELNESTSLSPPIYQTSTHVGRTAEEFAHMATEPLHPRFYARYGNPNHAQVQQVIAELEGAERALLLGSGMGAMSTAVISLVEAGDHVIAQNVHYAGTLALLEKVLAKFGVSTTFVDQADLSAFEDAVQPQTKLIVVETPTNPAMTLTDLQAVANLACQNNIYTIADNTFATPVNQRPLEFGIDLVLHSATKYLGGHHDLIAGAVAGTAEMIEKIWEHSLAIGASLNGFDSWLLLRGIRTMPLRMERHNQNGMTVAQALQDHPKVSTVYYPGLESHPQHTLAKKQMDDFGGMLSFELEGNFETTDRFISGLTMIDRAASLGGTHTLIVHPAAMLGAVLTEEQFIERGVQPSLVRLSVGLEDAQDIIDDIYQALDGA